MEPLGYEKRGYLNEDFRLFHLADSALSPLCYHYHSFHKLVVLLAGRVDYSVEGRHYALEAGDLVLVGRGSIHRPEPLPGVFYERMILYISPEALRRCSTQACDLSSCFSQAQQQSHYVYHIAAQDPILPLLRQLEAAQQEVRAGVFGAGIVSRSIFLQLMVALCRMCAAGTAAEAASSDRKIVAVLQYLNLHLAEPLSIEELAARFYCSKFHLMRRFKEETGYTIHSYVTEKRLLLARQYLQQGLRVAEAAEQAGYQDYSTFSRAYRKQFEAAPSQDRKK